MLAEITLTTEVIVFIGTVIIAVISIIMYLNAIDKRVTILETKTINRDEFYKTINGIKTSIEEKIESEISKIKNR